MSRAIIVGARRPGARRRHRRERRSRLRTASAPSSARSARSTRPGWCSTRRARDDDENAGGQPTPADRAHRPRKHRTRFRRFGRRAHRASLRGDRRQRGRDFLRLWQGRFFRSRHHGRADPCARDGQKGHRRSQTARSFDLSRRRDHFAESGGAVAGRPAGHAGATRRREAAWRGSPMAACGFDILLHLGREKGMSYFPLEGGPIHMPTVAREVFDVSGAGDTVVAAMAIALASEHSLRRGDADRQSRRGRCRRQIRRGDGYAGGVARRDARPASQGRRDGRPGDDYAEELSSPARLLARRSWPTVGIANEATFRFSSIPDISR